MLHILLTKKQDAPGSRTRWSLRGLRHPPSVLSGKAVNVSSVITAFVRVGVESDNARSRALRGPDPRPGLAWGARRGQPAARASRVPTCRDNDFLPRGCRPNLQLFPLPTAPVQDKWAWKASVGSRGFGHLLKRSCIAVPNPAPSLAVSIILGKSLEELPGGAPQST